MPKLGISFQIWFFPQFWGKKWRRSEHAPASNTGLSLFSPGFQAHFQGGVRGSPGTGLGAPAWRKPNLHKVMTSAESQEWVA